MIFARLFYLSVQKVCINPLKMKRIRPGVAQWLRRCATSRKVPGSIPGRVAGDVFRSIRQVQPLKISTRILLGVKAAGA